MKAIPTEMRRRILQDCDNGMTEHQAAQKWMVGCSAIAVVFFDFGKKQRCETGSIEPIQPKTGPKPKLAEHREILKQIVEVTPNVTLAEIKLSVLNHYGLSDRIPTREQMHKEVLEWNRIRNEQARTIDWRFTTADARIKLKRLYPLFHS
ncbi:MAG: hypothetical protein LBQ54_06850 [Planctomycetaceae bacterium]|nr:hypothetical protein [Planctomycetaceae bacterium]